MAAPGHQGGKVLHRRTRSIHNDKPLAFGAFAKPHHLNERTASPFLDGAQGLFFNGGQASRYIIGSRIGIHEIEIEGFRIVQAVVHNSAYIGGGLLIHRSFGQHIFSAQQLERLAHDDRAPRINKAVGKKAGHRVGNNSRRTVRPSALDSQNKFRPVHPGAAHSAGLMHHSDRCRSTHGRRMQAASVIFNGKPHRGPPPLLYCFGKPFRRLFFQGNNDHPIHVGMSCGVHDHALMNDSVYPH